MSREDYEGIPGMNFSNAKRLLRSGKHYLHGYERGDDEEEHFTIGSMVHAMVLEGKDLRSTYAIKPKGMSFASREGKAWKAAHLGLGLKILDEEADKRIPRIADAIASNKFARAFIKLCPLREHILRGVINDAHCKGLLDMAGQDSAGNPGFCEIKTLPDCRKAFFAKRVVLEPFHYDLQIVWYRRLMGGKIVWSIWIAAETRPPFDVAVYAPSDAMLASGEEKLRSLFTTYHACQDAQLWPGVQPDSAGIELLEPPRWRLYEMNHEYDQIDND